MGFCLAATARRHSSTLSWTLSRDVLARGAAALAVMALAGCETASGIRPPGRGIAEIADTDPKAASANIDSLSEVIRRNPSSAEAYNTRGVAYARIGRFQEAVGDFTQALKIEPNNAPAYTKSRARLSADGPRTKRRAPISTAASRSVPNMRPPMSVAPICCARRAISIRRSPISIRPFASILRARRPFMRADSFIRSAATTPAR